MTLGPLEPVQASSGSVSIQLQAGPSQLLSAQILTQVNFLMNYFMLDVLGMLVIVLYRFDTVPRQVSFLSDDSWCCCSNGQEK